MQENLNQNTEKTKEPETARLKTFESAKSKIEFISILLALAAIVGTGLLKIISFGQVAYFSFDLNYYDFTLNHIDLIVLFSILCFGGIALLYCVFTDPFRKTIISFIKKKPKVISYILVLLANIIWFILLPLVELIIYRFMVTRYSVIKVTIADFPYLLIFTIIVMVLVIMFWLALENHAIAYYITSFVIVFVVTISMTELKYDEASTKKYYDIIICEDNNNVRDYYSVISSGNKYSAYKCDIIPNDNGYNLIIYTKIHRFFALDSVSTISVCFERFDEETETYIPNVEFKSYADDKIV